MSQEGGATKGGKRAFRGLFLVFLLSFLSLFGVLLTVMALGGLGEWSRWQFIGLFGLIEAASGLANIVAPNIWRLPVAETQTKSSTDVKLAGSAMLLFHWGGAARTAAGLVLMAAATWNEGIGLSTLALLPLIAALAVIMLAASALVARLGVARPDLDVVQIVIRRAGRDFELAPISIGASVLQFVLGVLTIPFVKLFPPSAFYQPEIGASMALLGGTVVAALVLVLATWLAWAGRIDGQAGRDQQREAEEYA